MKTRKEFPLLLNSLGLVGEGAEIGVCQGHYSEEILKQWKGKKLYLIDSWKHFGKKLDVSDVDQFLQDTNKAMTVQRMKPFKARAAVVQADSVSASKKFGSGSLDFVYIDAAHDYRSVWADLQAWFPVVKTGGIVAGHDYKDSFVRKNLVEVKRAVDDFFRIHQLTVNTTTDDNLPSWFVVKKT